MSNDPNDTDNRIKKIKDAYQLILDRDNANFAIQRCINAIQFLESEMHTKFKSTKDFREKMDKYIAQISGATELKRVRESKGLSQEQLSRKLGYSEQFVYQIERGSRPLTNKIIKFIEKHG